MAISEEVRQVITILEEEGFGALAGEVLTEISLGREVEKPDLSVKGPDAEDTETIITRVPIGEEEQLTEVIAMLRRRLVEPVRALAEAERIAGDLVDIPGMRIRFVDPIEAFEIEPLSRGDLGVSTLADDLDALLERLPRMVGPPTASGI